MNSAHVFACDFTKDPCREDAFFFTVNEPTEAVFRVAFKIVPIFEANESMLLHVAQIGQQDIIFTRRGPKVVKRGVSHTVSAAQAER